MARTSRSPLDRLVAEIRACTLCAAELPLGPRPIVHLGQGTARVLVIGQAPGTKVHATGIPWNDASGDRLRQWMSMERDAFYDTSRLAIMPMGFCYPGRGKGGDMPPRPECAPRWHERVRARLPNVGLTLLIGQYAQAHYLGGARGRALEDTVRDWRRHLANGFFPLPHPSPRNTLWIKKRPWFDAEVVPALREALRTLETPRPSSTAAP